MGHATRSREDSGAKCDLNCRGLAHKASEEKNISLLTKDFCGNILVKNVVSLFLVQNNLPEAKMKSYGLTVLARKISRQSLLTVLLGFYC